MKSAVHTNDVPIHDFQENHLNNSIPFNYVFLDAPNNYDFSLAHRHSYYEIFFFSIGGGNHIIDFKSYPILDHSIHFVSPGQVHLLQRDPHTLGHIILFSRDFFYSSNEDKYTLFNYPFLNNTTFPILTASKSEFSRFEVILDEIAHESANNHTTSTQILRSYLKIILLKSLQLFKGKYHNIPDRKKLIFNAFQEAVEDEYRLERQPAYYALKLNITERTLNIICKESIGVNVSTYITQRVVLEAKRLLNNTDNKINQIASFLGFQDPSYFNRFFRSNTGCTAREFRNNYK